MAFHRWPKIYVLLQLCVVWGSDKWRKEGISGLPSGLLMNTQKIFAGSIIICVFILAYNINNNKDTQSQPSSVPCVAVPCTSVPCTTVPCTPVPCSPASSGQAAPVASVPCTPVPCTPSTGSSAVSGNIYIGESKTSPSFKYSFNQSGCGNQASRSLIAHGYFTLQETRLFRTLLIDRCKQLDAHGRPPLVVDVGANAGYFTLFAASMGCRVISFEIIKELFLNLHYQLYLNGFTQVTPYNNAISDSVGTTNFTLSCNDMGYSGIGVPQNARSQNQTVVSVRLEDIIKEDVLLLKIDTEGYEDHVFAGAMRLFENYNVRNMVVENKFTIRGEPKIKLLKTFHDMGYKLFSYPEDYRNLPEHVNMISSKPSRDDFKLYEGVLQHRFEDWLYTKEDINTIFQ
eukprot:TRINITY_DN4365_c0_g2_i2.p1 TRINITY_DN4365_c0_g2~~TRINITY_DN4365_c0_g2_i2.p1  ORF type:complete len:400 (-),score=33.40 TRINITY_DN4365_c0_g2_i2:114-1313(-)